MMDSPTQYLRNFILPPITPFSLPPSCVFEILRDYKVGLTFLWLQKIIQNTYRKNIARPYRKLYTTENCINTHTHGPQARNTGSPHTCGKAPATPARWLCFSLGKIWSYCFWSHTHTHTTTTTIVIHTTIRLNASPAGERLTAQQTTRHNS